MSKKKDLEWTEKMLKDKSLTKHQDVFIAKETDGFFRRSWLAIRRLALYKVL